MKRMKLHGTKKSVLFLMAVILLITVAAGSTIAWLVVSSSPITNTFVPSKVTSQVVESFDGSTKTDVQVKNTGDVDAYIRVALVPTWEDVDENIVPLSASISDLNISFNMTNWFKVGDYYYYKAKVAPDGLTTALVNSATVKTINGYKLNLQILCEAVQADPETAVESVWPVTVTNGLLG